MVLKAIRRVYTQEVRVSVYLRFYISQPKTKETANVLQPSNNFLIDTCLIGSQIFNNTKDIRFLPWRVGGFVDVQTF